MEQAERRGIILDVARLDHQLGLRGLTRRRFAELADVPEATLSRACHGRGIHPHTLRRLTTTLLETPLLAGADLLLADIPVGAG